MAKARLIRERLLVTVRGRSLGEAWISQDRL
jgi:hypothetical protein